MLFSAILSFAVPAVLAHLGVGTALTGVLGAAGAKLATQAVTGGVAAGVKQLLQHIHEGKPITAQQQAWVQQNSQELYIVPKLQPGTPKEDGPVVWDTPNNAK